VLKKYLIYLLRWQLSTPVLYLVMQWLPVNNNLISAIVANLVGGLMFFWIDRRIFKK
jgi:putative flippase GtrA